MIIAAQPFFNELDLLELKLQVMAHCVDLFVIMEATRTYTGNSKPLFYHENRDRFSPFVSKIKHVVVDDELGYVNPWERENLQRNRLYVETMAEKPDIVLWTDTDEVTTAEAIHEFVQSGHKTAALEHDWLRYYFNREHGEKWRQRVISRDGRHHIVCTPDMPVIKNAGWHFNFCTPKQQLLDKINATSHAIEFQSPWYYNEIWQGRKPKLEETVEYPRERLPLWLQQNADKFPGLFL